VSAWVSSFLAAHQCMKGRLVPSMFYTINLNYVWIIITNKMSKMYKIKAT